MPTVAITAQVDDAAKWEQGFRTHGDLFVGQTVNSPIRFAVDGQNNVVVVFEMEDLDKYLSILDSPATHEAMSYDGVNRDTVKVFVLEGKFDPR